MKGLAHGPDPTGETDLPVPTLPTGQDLEAVKVFERFLRTVGPPSKTVLEVEHRGWIPWALGFGPEPPEGMDHIPLTAWCLPG